MPISPALDNKQYQSDMKFGFNQEEVLKPKLEEKYGELITLEKYSTFDYENDEYLIELKSRRINHDKHPTAMVNYSKILKTKDSPKTRVIVFNYRDGLYEWVVNKDEYTLGTGGRCDRGCEEYYTMAYVPTEHLIRMGQ